jgi:hypothetical protein
VFFDRRETFEWRYKKTPEDDGLRYKAGKNDEIRRQKC